MLSTDFELALTHLRAGRASDAVAILSRLVERWPTYAAAQVAYAQALHQLGRPEESFHAWSRAEALVSHSGVVASGLRTSATAMFAFDEVSAGPALEPEESEQPEADVASDVETFDTPAEEATDAETPQFSDAPAMDPAFFVPVATPFDEHGDDEPSVDEPGKAEWSDGPTQATDPAAGPDRPEWNGGYAGETGDGADSDLELDAPPAEADLDRLIGELESARIVPADDPSSIPPPDLSDDIDDVVSETLARIYATQNQFSEAARVYERLALENPDRAGEYHSKASEMRARER